MGDTEIVDRASEETPEPRASRTDREGRLPRAAVEAPRRAPAPARGARPRMRDARR